jgi:hypothetical protein
MWVTKNTLHSLFSYSEFILLYAMLGNDLINLIKGLANRGESTYYWVLKYVLLTITVRTFSDIRFYGHGFGTLQGQIDGRGGGDAGVRSAAVLRHSSVR